MKKIIFKDSIAPLWESIKIIEKKISNCFITKNSEIYDSTIMVATELLENAIKYSACSLKTNSINFNFIKKENSIIIALKNPVDKMKHIKIIDKNLKKIEKYDDPQKAYVKRLKELVKNKKKDVSRLGLFRIAYEGKFKLSYKYKKNILTMTAQRKLL